MSVNQPPVGAHAVGPQHRRRPGWLWLLLVLAALVLLFVLLSRCGSDTSSSAPGKVTPVAPSAPSSLDPSPTATLPTTTSSSLSPSSAATSSSAPPTTATGTASTTRSTAAGAGAGSLTAAGEPLLPLSGSAPDGTLTAYAGQPVKASGVRVQSVPADEGFWVGNSTTDRVWVQLVGKAGESPYQIKAGKQVTFTGKLVPNPRSFADSVGVDAEEGAAQLTRQKNHIEVNKNAVAIP